MVRESDNRIASSRRPRECATRANKLAEAETPELEPRSFASKQAKGRPKEGGK